QVYADNGVELRLFHLQQRFVSEDPSIIYEDVDRAEGLHRVADDAFGLIELRDVAVIGDGLAAFLLDLFAREGGRIFRAAAPVEKTHVVSSCWFHATLATSAAPVRICAPCRRRISDCNARGSLRRSASTTRRSACRQRTRRSRVVRTRSSNSAETSTSSIAI